MDERGWTTSEADLLEIRFLDWVDSYQASGRIPGALSFYQRDEVTEDEKNVLIEVVRDLEARGLIAGQMSLAGWATFGAMLTSYGIRTVRDRQQRRNSRRARSVAARDALLDWMYENTSEASGEAPEIEEFAGTVHAHFEGDPFTESEINTAVQHLRDEDYITGVRVWGAPHIVRPKVTTKGRRAVESDRYTAEAAQGHDRDQQQTFVINRAAVAEYVAEVRRRLSTLPEVDRATGEAYLVMIEQEAESDDPNPGVITAALKGLKWLGEKVGEELVGIAVGALIAYATVQFGLPAIGS